MARVPKNILPDGESGFANLYQHYKRIAKIRGHDFRLDKAAFRTLTKGNCIYCGAKPNCVRKTSASYKRGRPGYVYNGIDRVDNRLGYTTDNVVTCCRRCNTMKMDMTTQEFREHIIRIHERFSSWM